MLNHVIKIVCYYIVARIIFYRFGKWKILSLFVKVTIISKLIHISSRFQKSNRIFYTSDGESVEKRVSIFPFKGNFHSIFRRFDVRCSRSQPRLSTLNVTQSSSFRLSSARKTRRYWRTRWPVLLPESTSRLNLRSMT